MTEERKSHFPLLPVNWSFLILAAAFLTLGSMAQAAHFEWGILFTEYGLLVLPLVMMGLYLKVDLKRALRLNPLPVSVGFKIAGASLLMIPGVAVLNITVIALLTTMFHYIPQNMVQPSAGAGFLVSFFVMAITPGICEELFFRGMMMNAFEGRLGYRFAAVLSAVLFGLFHFNLANLLGPIFLGLLFAWLVQVTNSIYAGMIGHAVNNGFAVTVSYLMTRGQQVTMDTGVDLSELFLENRDMLIASLFGAVGLLLVIAVPTVLLGLAVYRSIRLDYLKSGDLLKVAGRQYVVTGGSGSKVWLYPYDVAPPAENYEDAIRLVDVNALRQDRQIRMASRHWIKVRTQGMALGESLPLWAGAVIYIAIGIYMLMLFRGIFA
jgi:hypothetical protein